MRYTIHDTAAIIGMSVPQTRRRIDAIRTELNGDLHRGSRGAVLLSDRGLALLRRAVDLEKDRGLSCHDAVKVVLEETDNADQDNVKGVVNDREVRMTEPSELIVVLRAQIEDQRRQIDFLQRQIEMLTPLALPRPRRAFLTLFRRRKGDGK